MQKKDLLSRQNFINILTKLIESKVDANIGYSIAIDGKWGCGKTFILEMLEEQLAGDSLIFHYNAWKNDFYEEPLIAILSVFIDTLNKNKVFIAEKEGTSNLLKIFVELLGKLTENKLGININSIFTKIKDTKEDFVLSPEDFNDILPLENALSVIQQGLTEISKTKPIILLVDELDRCLPKYAIKVLERLHHLCDGQKIIQIISVDKMQLADSIAKVYGKDYSNETKEDKERNIKEFADLYLQKFIDITLPLSCGTIPQEDDIFCGILKNYEPEDNSVFPNKIPINKQDFLQISKILLNGIDRRMQEKMFPIIETCDKFAKSINPYFKDFHYGLLVYEIISCIKMYILHDDSNIILTDNNSISLNSDFFNKHTIYHNNLKQLFNTNNFKIDKISDMYGNKMEIFKINSPITYVLGYFLPDNLLNFVSMKYDSYVHSSDKSYLEEFDTILKSLTIEEHVYEWTTKNDKE